MPSIETAVPPAAFSLLEIVNGLYPEVLSENLIHFKVNLFMRESSKEHTKYLRNTQWSLLAAAEASQS